LPSALHLGFTPTQNGTHQQAANESHRKPPNSSKDATNQLLDEGSLLKMICRADLELLEPFPDKVTRKVIKRQLEGRTERDRAKDKSDERWQQGEAEKARKAEEERRAAESGDMGSNTAKRVSEVLNHEQLHKDKALSGLNRNNLSAAVATDGDKLVLRFLSTLEDGGKWAVTEEMQISVFNHQFLANAEHPTDQEVFTRSTWMGDIMHIDDGEILARFNKVKIDKDLTWILQKDILEELDVIVSERDPMADKLSAGLHNADEVIQYESGLMDQKHFKEKPWVKLLLPMMPIIAPHSSTAPASWKSTLFPFKNGGSDFVYEDRHQLVPSHKAALSAMAKSKGGFSGFQGPPGCGKTTLDGKAIDILFEQCNLEWDRVAAMAHSNVAVRAMLKALFWVLPAIFGMSTDRICWVESKRSRQERLLKGEGQEYEHVTLEYRRREIAEANPTSYPQYSETNEAPEDSKMAKQWQDERKSIDAIIRRKCSIFVSTVSAAVCPFFRVGGDKMDKRMHIDALFIDEVTQTTWPHLFLAWITLSPRIINVHGDQNQLTPFCYSIQAAAILNHTILEVMMERAPKNFVLLDTAFRIPAHLYQPTSKTFYEGKIGTHPSTENRPAGRDLVEKLKKIEISPKGDDKWYRLGHTMMVFDVRGKVEGNETHSIRNNGEIALLVAFATALVEAGVEEKDFVFLSPYAYHTETLKGQMADFPAGDIACVNIDAFQGGEKNVVCLSTVTNNDSPNAFLAAKERHNVGTSRWREVGVIVGNMNVLLSPRFGRWREYMLAIQNANRNIGMKKDEMWWECSDDVVFRVESKWLTLCAQDRQRVFTPDIVCAY
jgi:hypothetical protein